MKKLIFALCMLPFIRFIFTPALASPLPVGAYRLSVHTPTSGVHSSSDQGTLSGTLAFDTASNLVSANLVFDDTTTGTTFSFSDPGPTNIAGGDFLSATLYNAVNPNTFYQLSLALPGDPSGGFTLICGTDCHTWMDLDQRGPNPVYVELNFGEIAPTVVPEPSSLLLVGTGLFTGIKALRQPRPQIGPRSITVPRIVPGTVPGGFRSPCETPKSVLDPTKRVPPFLGRAGWRYWTGTYR